MSKKICSRCYFAVDSKRRSCHTCGNKNFLPESEIPTEEQQPDSEFKDQLRSAWRELHSELIQTSSKSMRAAKRIIELVSQRGVQGGSR